MLKPKKPSCNLCDTINDDREAQQAQQGKVLFDVSNLVLARWDEGWNSLTNSYSAIEYKEF